MKTLHVQKKHVIEYAENSFFNYSMEDINILLKTLCDGFWGDNIDYDALSNEVEVYADHFKRLIGYLKEKREKILEYNNLPVDRYNIDELIEAFEYIYDNSDKSDGMIHLTWF